MPTTITSSSRLKFRSSDVPLLGYQYHRNGTGNVGCLLPNAVRHVSDTGGVTTHFSVLVLVPPSYFEVGVDFRIKLSERSAGDSAEKIGEG